MYVSLFVRDECERSVKNQALKVESVGFAIGSQVAREKQITKKPCVEHMTGRKRVVPGCHFRNCLVRRANPRRTRESLCLAKSCVCFTKSLPTLYIYPYYPQSVISTFQREKPRKYT